MKAENPQYQSIEIRRLTEGYVVLCTTVNGWQEGYACATMQRATEQVKERALRLVDYRAQPPQATDDDVEVEGAE